MRSVVGGVSPAGCGGRASEGAIPGIGGADSGWARVGHVVSDPLPRLRGNWDHLETTDRPATGPPMESRTPHSTTLRARNPWQWLLRASVDSAAAGNFPSAWRGLQDDSPPRFLAQFGHKARWGWVVVRISEKGLHWSWQWSEPKWRQVVKAEVAPPPAPAAAPEAGPTPVELPGELRRIKHTLTAPGTIRTARFHASQGPRETFTAVERYAQRFLRLRLTRHSRDKCGRMLAPIGIVSSLPIGWQLVDVLLHLDTGELQLSYGYALPEGLLILRVRPDGSLMLVEWRDPTLIPSNILDTPETRKALVKATRVLGNHYGLPPAAEPSVDSTNSVDVHAKITENTEDLISGLGPRVEDELKLYEQFPDLPRVHWDGSWTHESRVIDEAAGLRLIANRLGASIAAVSAWKRRYRAHLQQRRQARECELRAFEQQQSLEQQQQQSVRDATFEPASKRSPPNASRPPTGGHTRSRSQAKELPDQPKLPVDKDTEFNRKTQGDNWY